MDDATQMRLLDIGPAVCLAPFALVYPGDSGEEQSRAARLAGIREKVEAEDFRDAWSLHEPDFDDV